MLARVATAALAIGLASACTEAKEPSPSAPAPVAAPSPKIDWNKAFRHEIAYDATQGAVVVDLEVAPGFHAYTVGESTGRPLQLTVDEACGYAVEGQVQYPEGETKMLPVGKSVIVEGKAKVVAGVKAQAEPAGTKINGRFRYQVCTDEICDRPRTVPYEVAVR